MATLWLTGFEHGLASIVATGGGLADTVSGTPVVVTSPVRSGTYALRCQASGSSVYIQKTVASSNYVVGSFYFYFKDALPSADCIFFRAINTDADMVFNFESSDNTITAGKNGVAGGISSSSTITYNTWYRIDFRFFTGGTTHTIDWVLATGDAAGTAQTQYTVSSRTNVQMTAIRVGTSAVTADAHFDDIICVDSSAAYPIGAFAVEGLRPNDDVTYDGVGTNVMESSDGTDISATNKASGYLDENPWTSAYTTDYVRQTANGTSDYCDIAFTDTTRTTILGAMALLQFASATDAACTGGCVMYDEDSTATTLWGAVGALAAYRSNGAANYKSVAMPTPAGGWDAAAVNAIHCRFGYSGDANPDPYWLAIMLEVAYASAASATISGPTPVAGQFSLADPTATATANISISSSPIAGQFSTAEPAVKISTSSVPSAVSGQFSQYDPSITATAGPTIVTPEPVGGTFSVIAETIKIAVEKVVDVVTGIFTQLAPAVMASALVVVSPVAGQLDLSPPTISAAGAVTVTAEPIAGTFSASGFTAQVSTVYVASAVTGQFSAVDPAAGVIASATVTPGPATGQFETKDPSSTATASAIFSLSPVAGTFSQPAPTTSATASTSTSPSSITGQFSLLTPSVTAGGGVTIAAAPIAGQFSLLEPTTSGSCLVAPAHVSGQLSVVSPASMTHALVSPTQVAGQFSVVAPTVTAGCVVAPSHVSGTLSLSAPTISVQNPGGGPVTITPDPIDGQFSASSFTAQITTAYLPSQVTGQFEAVEPSAYVVKSVTVAASPVTGQFEASEFDSSQDVSMVPAENTGAFELLSAQVMPGTASAIVGVSPISGTLSIAAEPPWKISSLATPAPVSGRFEVNPVSVHAMGDVAIFVDSIGGTFSPVDPTMQSAGSVTVIPSPVDGQFSIATQAVEAESGTAEIYVKIDGTWTVISGAGAYGGSTSYAVTPEAYGAIGDGVTDDTVAIQAALIAANGERAVEGGNNTYLISSSLTLAAGQVLQNIKLTTATNDIKMVKVNSRCKLLNVCLTGTGNYEAASFGVYPAADGVSDVDIDACVHRLQYGVYSDYINSESICKRWSIKLLATDMAYTAGPAPADGVAVLMAYSENFQVHVRGSGFYGGGVYVSAGSRWNDITVDLQDVRGYGVQLQAYPEQTECSYNRVRGAVEITGVSASMYGWGAVLSQKAHYNDISLRVYSNNTSTFGIVVQGYEGADITKPFPYGNIIHDCVFVGQFTGTDIVRLSNQDSTIVSNNQIYGWSSVSAIAIRYAGAHIEATGAVITGNIINTQGNAVIGIYNEINAPWVCQGNRITNNGGAKKIESLYDPSYPTSGLWEKGDYVENTSPSDESCPGWYCTSRTDTTVRVQANATDTTIEVAATTSILAGDIIGLVMDNGATHWTTVASITDGDTLVISSGIPASRSCYAGAAIYTYRWYGIGKLQPAGNNDSPNFSYIKLDNPANPFLWLDDGSNDAYLQISSGALELRADTGGMNTRISAGNGGGIAELDGSGNLSVNGVYKVDGTQVLGNQGAAVADATGAGDVVAQLNTLLARLRAHGVIAT